MLFNILFGNLSLKHKGLTKRSVLTALCALGLGYLWCYPKHCSIVSLSEGYCRPIHRRHKDICKIAVEILSVEPYLIRISSFDPLPTQSN